MQVIRGTYEAYKPHPDRGPYKNGVSIDAYSNIYAGLNYALHRYPSLAYAMNKPGGYDSGGIARGRGLMAKNIIAPERVLSPQQTKSFDRLVDTLDRGNTRMEMVITNWETGKGYIREIADDSVATASEFAGTRRRMR
jgi:hypothetical protein